MQNRMGAMYIYMERYREREREIVKKRGLGHFGEQEGLQKGSGRSFRLFKYMGGEGMSAEQNSHLFFCRIDV